MINHQSLIINDLTHPPTTHQSTPPPTNQAPATMMEATSRPTATNATTRTPPGCLFIGLLSCCFQVGVEAHHRCNVSAGSSRAKRESDGGRATGNVGQSWRENRAFGPHQGDDPAKGNRTENVLPFCTWLATLTAPPIAWHRCLTIDSPSPVPPSSRRAGLVDPVEPLEEPRRGARPAMPMPVSATSMHGHRAVAAGSES